SSALARICFLIPTLIINHLLSNNKLLLKIFLYLSNICGGSAAGGIDRIVEKDCRWTRIQAG
ncbi:MAG TPA: hypothetical protein ACFCUC_13855, partial [Desulfobacterales bacterium]